MNRLRWHLLQFAPSSRLAPARGAERPASADRVDRGIAELPRRPRSGSHASRSPQICAPEPPGDEQLERELLELVKAHRPQLLAEHGCGPLTAAILIGHTAGAKRFPTTRASRARPGPRRSLLLGPAPTGTDSTAAATASSTTRCTSSRSPAPARPRHEGIPRAQGSRRQDQEGRAPLPQAPPRPPLLAPALPPPRHTRSISSPSRPTPVPQSPLGPQRSCHAPADIPANSEPPLT